MQNKEDNIRDLKIFRAKLYAYAKNFVFPVTSSESNSAQIFSSGKTYYLQKNSETFVGSTIKDSVQQVLEQDQQQQQVQEQEFEAEKFNGDIAELVCRNESNNKLFSRLVGSAFDAAHIISHITPEAYAELIRNDKVFQFGLSYEYLPAGFYLTKFQDNQVGLILGFNSNLRKTMLRHTQFNPMRQVLRDPRVSPPSAVNVDNILENISINEKIAMNEILRPHFTVEKGIYESQLFEIIGGWVGFWEPTKLLVIHQIFESYGKEGVETFVTMEEILYKTGERNLLNDWREYVVYPSSDASHLLSEEEMNAIAESAQCFNKTLGDVDENNRLKSNKQFFCTLFSEHVKRHNFAYYSDVWNAYKEFSNLINQDELNLSNANRNIYSWLNSPDVPFHAVVFLERLTFVLKAVRNHESTKDIQQNILDYLSDIDWSHSGLFYAMRYKQGEGDLIYFYWDKDLVLTQGFPFNTKLWFPFDENEDRKLSLIRVAYDPSLSYPSDIASLLSSGDAIVNMLRFAARNIGLSWGDYNTFKAIIKTSISDSLMNFDEYQNFDDESGSRQRFTEINALLGNRCPTSSLMKMSERIFLGVLMLSREKMSISRMGEYVNVFQSILRYERRGEHGNALGILESAINLQGKMETGVLHIGISDVVDLIDALNINYYLFSEASSSDFILLDRDKLNIISRAFVWYKKLNHTGMNFESILNIYLRDGLIDFNHPYLRYCPWLTSEISKEDFSNSFDFMSRSVSSQEDIVIKKNIEQEFTFLKSQLESLLINEMTSVDCLPTHDEIRECFQNMWANPYSSFDIRQLYINIWKDRGCIFSLESPTFRVLSEDEIKRFQNATFKSNCHEINAKLLDRFILYHSSLNATDDASGILRAQETVGNFLRFCHQLDYNRRVNNLGLVLGTLIEHAKQDDKRYSLDQLLKWLSLFLKDNNEEDVYPLVLLKTLLKIPAFETSLCNSNLSLLKTDIPSHIPLLIIENICRASYKEIHKANLFKQVLDYSLDQRRSVDSFALIEYAHQRVETLVRRRTYHFVDMSIKKLDYIEDCITDLSLNKRAGVFLWQNNYYIFDNISYKCIFLDPNDSMVHPLYQRCLDLTSSSESSNSSLTIVLFGEEIERLIEEKLGTYVSESEKDGFIFDLLTFGDYLQNQHDSSLEKIKEIFLEASRAHDERFYVTSSAWIKAQRQLMQSAYATEPWLTIDEIDLLSTKVNARERMLCGLMWGDPEKLPIKAIGSSQYICMALGTIDSSLLANDTYDNCRLYFLDKSRGRDDYNLHPIGEYKLKDLTDNLQINTRQPISLLSDEQFDFLARIHPHIVLKQDIISERSSPENIITFDKKHMAIRFIIAHCIQAHNNLVRTVQTELLKWNSSELLSLAQWIISPPSPKLNELSYLLCSSHNVASLEMAYRVNNFTKLRKYYDKNLPQGDKRNVTRVLNGLRLQGIRDFTQLELDELLFKLKMCDDYAQSSKLNQSSFNELQNLLCSISQERWTNGSNQIPVNVRWLAVIREVILRKQFKWLKHTQLIDLLYATSNPDENLIHRIRTGEGKTLITLVSNLYDLYRGKNVVCFSSDEVLSLRDHELCSSLLDDLNIRHNYLNSSSDVASFAHQVSANRLGSIHFATPLQFALFYMKLVVQGHAAGIDLTNMIAYIDEIDAIIEQTKTTIANFTQTPSFGDIIVSPWIYEATLNYLRLLREDTQDSNHIEINDTILEGFYTYLLTEKSSHSDQATADFWAEYIEPAQSHGVHETHVRDQRLLGLLRAAHEAWTKMTLEENKTFCIASKNKKVGRSVFETRFVALLAENQLLNGTQVGAEVHQFLHSLYNISAAEDGFRPNFILDPINHVLFSMNVTTLLQHCFAIRKGCTATPGKERELKYYKTHLSINSILNIKHDQPSKRNDDVIYSEIDDDFYGYLIDCIVDCRNKGHSFLLDCEDDSEVKLIGEELQTRLNNIDNISTPLFLDLNSNDKLMSDILRDANMPGAVTVSSRLRRGVDIKSDWLEVHQCYNTLEFKKSQAAGRTARNGKEGSFTRHINLSKIYVEDAKYKSSLYNDEYIQLLQETKEYLTQKVIKHKSILGTENSKPRSKYWANLVYDGNEALLDYEVMCRACALMKQRIEDKHSNIVQQKDFLFSSYSEQVILKIKGEKLHVRSQLIKKWGIVYHDMQQLWGQFKLQSISGTVDVSAFCATVNSLWQAFCLENLVDSKIIDRWSLNDQSMFFNTTDGSSSSALGCDFNLRLVPAFFGGNSRVSDSPIGGTSADYKP